MSARIDIGPFCMGDGPVVIVAGPCVLESLDLALRVAAQAKGICDDLGLPYVFKSSFDKANRTSIKSFRGPGLEKGLQWLARVKEDIGVPVLTDIHLPDQAEVAADVVDVLQIPAFLCRQTDLVVAAAKTGKPVNIKKAQFLSPYDMAPVVEKCRAVGNEEVILCERGSAFGYRELVVDMRSIPVMRSLGCPVMFDATHSVQMPGGRGSSSGGDRRFVRPLARAALSIGIDSLFLEVHPDPDSALSDGPNMIPLGELRAFLREVKEIDELVKGSIGPCLLEGESHGLSS